MCLSQKINIGQLKKTLVNGVGEGYKGLCSRDGKLYFPAQGNHDKPIPVGKWIDEKDFRATYSANKKNIYIDYSYCQRYPLGFHISMRYKSARGWGGRVHKVRFKDVVAYGVEGYFSHVAVARKMMVLPPRKK